MPRYFNIYGYDDNLDFGGSHHNPYLRTVRADSFEQAEAYAMTLPRFYCEMFGRGYITEIDVVELEEKEC